MLPFTYKVNHGEYFHVESTLVLPDQILCRVNHSEYFHIESTLVLPFTYKVNHGEYFHVESTLVLPDTRVNHGAYTIFSCRVNFGASIYL